MLNHCLSWSKLVNAYLYHYRQWFNLSLASVYIVRCRVALLSYLSYLHSSRVGTYIICDIADILIQVKSTM